SGLIAVLIDPEKSSSTSYLVDLIEKITRASIDIIFVGGSSVSQVELENCIRFLKSISDIPIVIFPGSSNQVSEDADAVLFLNLISGRNPDYLIGHQVQAAFKLHTMDIEIIPTGYILVDGKTNSS